MCTSYSIKHLASNNMLSDCTSSACVCWLLIEVFTFPGNPENPDLDQGMTDIN